MNTTRPPSGRHDHLGQLARISGLVRACDADPSAARRQRVKARKWKARLEARQAELHKSLSVHAAMGAMTDEHGWPAQIRVIAQLGRALGKLEGSDLRAGGTA